MTNKFTYYSTLAQYNNVGALLLCTVTVNKINSSYAIALIQNSNRCQMVAVCVLATF